MNCSCLNHHTAVTLSLRRTERPQLVIIFCEFVAAYAQIALILSRIITDYQILCIIPQNSKRTILIRRQKCLVIIQAKLNKPEQIINNFLRSYLILAGGFP